MVVIGVMCAWDLIMKKWWLSLVVCSIGYGQEMSYWLAQKELLTLMESPSDIVKVASPLYYIEVLSDRDREHSRVAAAVDAIIRQETFTWSEKTVAWGLRTQWKLCNKEDAAIEKKETYKAIRKTNLDDKVRRQVQGMFEDLWLRCTKK